jgi:hypothetical protein
MTQQDAPAVAIARTHIQAWSHHDWEKTRELLAPDVHAVVTGTQRDTTELTGIETYMERKKKGAQLVEPGSAQVISTIGDERNALILATMRIALGPGGSMVSMARAMLYLLDENKKIKEERDKYFVLSQEHE